MKSKSVFAVIVILLIAAGAWFWFNSSQDKPANSSDTNATTNSSNSQYNQTQPPADFNKDKYSLTDPTSVWVIVNKQNPLDPKTYVPADLVSPDVAQRVPGAQEMKMRKTAAAALEKMAAAASADGAKVLISTAYRGYGYQSTLYSGYVHSSGQANADKTSARPGYSEHQTGLAVDLRAQSGKCSLEQCFGDTTEGKWLAANAYKYGFLLRYPQDKESVTGYEYEPWHFRYIGPYLSKEMHQQGVETMEEFFGVKGGTAYN